jgi:hypothetical protein
VSQRIIRDTENHRILDASIEAKNLKPFAVFRMKVGSILETYAAAKTTSTEEKTWQNLHAAA